MLVVVVVEVVGLLTESQGLPPEWVVHAFRISRVAAHLLESKKLALQAVVGK